MHLFIAIEGPKEMLKFDGDVEEFKVIYEVHSEILDHLHHVNFELVFGWILSSEYFAGDQSEIKFFLYYFIVVVEFEVEGVRLSHEVFRKWVSSQLFESHQAVVFVLADFVFDKLHLFVEME